MTTTLRPLRLEDLDKASALCLRSKAYWGYDAAFMAACVEELTLTETDLTEDAVAGLEDTQGLAGVAHVYLEADGCYLDKLFVDTDRMGRGYGKHLFGWAVEAARELGAHELIIEADPGAAPFYERLGCIRAGEAPSGSVAGRVLPRFVFSL